MKLYRYSNGTGGTIFLEEFSVVRETPKGKWVDAYGAPKFVLNDAYKQFACATKEIALVSFRRRKSREVDILEARLKNARSAYERAKDATPETLETHEPYFTFEDFT